MCVRFITVRNASVLHETVVKGVVRCQQTPLRLGHSCISECPENNAENATAPSQSQINPDSIITENKWDHLCVWIQSRKKTKSAIIIEDGANWQCQLSLQQMGEKQLCLNYNIIRVQLSSAGTISDKRHHQLQMWCSCFLSEDVVLYFYGHEHVCRWTWSLMQHADHKLSSSYIKPHF